MAAAPIINPRIKAIESKVSRLELYHYLSSTKGTATWLGSFTDGVRYKLQRGSKLEYFLVTDITSLTKIAGSEGLVVSTGSTGIGGVLDANINPLGVTPTVFSARRFQVTINGGYSFDVNPIEKVRSGDSFTAVGTGAVDDTIYGVSVHSLLVSNSGVTTYTVLLEGSINGTNFETILSISNVDGSPKTKFVSGTLVRYIRTRCSAFTGTGTLTTNRLSEE